MKKFLLYTVAAALGLFAGIGIGAASDSGGSTVAAPTPTVTATVTKTDTVTKTSTPDSCLLALDLADEGFGLAVQAMEAASDGFTAVAEYDITALEEVNDRISGLGEEIGEKADPYNAAKAECRSGS
jgi:hypothetical protein